MIVIMGLVNVKMRYHQYYSETLINQLCQKALISDISIKNNDKLAKRITGLSFLTRDKRIHEQDDQFFIEFQVYMKREKYYENFSSKYLYLQRKNFKICVL